MYDDMRLYCIWDARHQLGDGGIAQNGKPGLPKTTPSIGAFFHPSWRRLGGFEGAASGAAEVVQP